MTDPSPKQRKRIYRAQFRVSGASGRAFSRAVSSLIGLLILALIASFALRTREAQAQSLFAALVFTLLLGAGLGSVLLGVRRLLQNIAGSAFQKGGGRNSVSFKWTVGPVVTKTRVVHNLNALPPEVANNPVVQQFLHRPEVQKLLEQQQSLTSASESSVIDVDASRVESTPLESLANSSPPHTEVRVITNAENRGPEFRDDPEAKAFLAEQRPQFHRDQAPERPDILKWLAIFLSVGVLVLGCLLLFLYLRSTRH